METNLKNRDIYQVDPSTRKLVNEGVANVNDDSSEQALTILKYELETFVCDGQYEKGIEHILETYINNLNQSRQPAVWVSGFFGSGKSHLVKMLRALWVDTPIDSTTAREIVVIPETIKTLLKELTIQGKRYGGLHAAAGTLGSAANGSVRLALLGIIFKSLGLPEQYSQSKFILRLKQEGIEEKVRQEVEGLGYVWEEELANFYVAEGLHQALVKIKPQTYPSIQSCINSLNNTYPYKTDVSNDEMIAIIKQALSNNDRFPLTLIVLDEIQQFIGTDSQRSIEVQEMVEACCNQIGAKLLFIGTGQTAVTGTPNLRRLEGRFTVRVELSDADVESVIRKVVLAKKPSATKFVDQLMQKNLGEISRQLADTSLRHRQEDISVFVQDYPLLPVRRRFWEYTLRVMDQTGTYSQLRNQLSMVHKVIQASLDLPLGTVIPADYLYFDSADKLLQARILPRKVHERTMTWKKGTDDQQIMARACGLVFLINKLSSSNKEIGIKATINTIADLLVEDIEQGSSSIRAKLPSLLDSCDLLMKVGEEYRIQTEASKAWDDEFQSQRSELSNTTHRIDTERNDRLRKVYDGIVRNLTLAQGESRLQRDVFLHTGSTMPIDSNKKIIVWIRDGWEIDENSVKAEALQSGNESPLVLVHIPKRSADDLRNNLIDYKAASATLEKKGAPNTPEDIEAKASMETIKQNSEARINELINECLSGAHVFQSGGIEVSNGSLKDSVLEACKHSIDRLYPQFRVADHAGWEKVVTKAQAGAPDSLKAVGFDGEVPQQPVCKQVLTFIGNSKKGFDIRSYFEEAPYGWSRDAVDGALYALYIGNHIRALDERAQSIDQVSKIERKAIGKVVFKIESTTISTAQRIQIRKVYQELNVPCQPGAESTVVHSFLTKLEELITQAGGEAPLPEKPKLPIIDEIFSTSGNDQLLLIYNNKETLIKSAELWDKTAKEINKRTGTWNMLKDLLKQSESLANYDEINDQVDAIIQHRQLLNEPDFIVPLTRSLEQALRDQLSIYFDGYKDVYTQSFNKLISDPGWNKLDLSLQEQILMQCGISIPVKFDIGTPALLLSSLKANQLQSWPDKIDALKGRFQKAIELAIKESEPKVQMVELNKQTLRSENDIDAWLMNTRKTLVETLKIGPVLLK